MIILRGAEKTPLALVLNLSKCELEFLPFKICEKRTSIPLMTCWKPEIEDEKTCQLSQSLFNITLEVLANCTLQG